MRKIESYCLNDAAAADAFYLTFFGWELKNTLLRRLISIVTFYLSFTQPKKNISLSAKNNVLVYVAMLITMNIKMLKMERVD